jgi:hypothetical protein
LLGVQWKDYEDGQSCKEARCEEGDEEACGEEEEVTSFCLEFSELTVMFGRVIPGVLIAALLLPSAAQAASIANRDDSDHTVTVIEGNSQKDHVLKPNAVLDGICGTGCLIRIDNSQDEPFELQSSDVTSIEEGQLYDDEAAVPSESGSVPDAQPSQPGSRP